MAFGFILHQVQPRLNAPGNVKNRKTIAENSHKTQLESTIHGAESKVLNQTV